MQGVKVTHAPRAGAARGRRRAGATVARHRMRPRATPVIPSRATLVQQRSCTRVRASVACGPGPLLCGASRHHACVPPTCVHTRWRNACTHHCRAPGARACSLYTQFTLAAQPSPSWSIDNSPTIVATQSTTGQTRSGARQCRSPQASCASLLVLGRRYGCLKVGVAGAVVKLWTRSPQAGRWGAGPEPRARAHRALACFPSCKVRRLRQAPAEGTRRASGEPAQRCALPQALGSAAPHQQRPPGICAI